MLRTVRVVSAVITAGVLSVASISGPLADEQSGDGTYVRASAGAVQVEIPDFNYGDAGLVHGKFDDLEDHGVAIEGAFGFYLPPSLTNLTGPARVEFGFRYQQVDIKGSNALQPSGGNYVSVNAASSIFSGNQGRGTLDADLEEFEVSKTLFLDSVFGGKGPQPDSFSVIPFVRGFVGFGSRDTHVDVVDIFGGNPFNNFVDESISTFRLGLGAGLDTTIPLGLGGAFLALRAGGGLTYISADASVNDCANFANTVPCNGAAFRTSATDSLSELSYHARAEGRITIPIVDGISTHIGGWVEALERPQVKYPGFVGDAPARVKLRGVYQAGVMGGITIELP